MVRIAKAFEDVKNSCEQMIPATAILGACHLMGYRFRRRILGPVETVFLFLIQILHGNNACSALRHQASLPCSIEAYCMARRRLPAAVLRYLLDWVCRSLRKATDEGSRWLGHRVFHVDGSSFSMSDTPDLQEAFGQPGWQKPGCGFPTAHMLLLTDAATGLIMDISASPLRTHEMSRVSLTHSKLQAGDVLVADRGFCSYAHLALIFQADLHAVFRMHQRTIVDFTPSRPHADRKPSRSQKGMPRSQWIRFIGLDDQVVRWFKPQHKPHWISAEQYAELPDSLLVRELRYRMESHGYRTRRVTLATTLLDETKYTADELSDVYLGRWKIEVNLRHLKQTMGMDILRCRSADGVLKEMMVFALIYNLVCCVIHDAAARQTVPPDRISFIDAWRWLQTNGPNGELIDLIVNPYRHGRVEPRVVKRRPKSYALMTQPRKTLRKCIIDKRVTA